jgi:hypothetical protein
VQAVTYSSPEELEALLQAGGFSQEGLDTALFKAVVDADLVLESVSTYMSIYLSI